MVARVPALVGQRRPPNPNPGSHAAQPRKQKAQRKKKERRRVLLRSMEPLLASHPQAGEGARRAGLGAAQARAKPSFKRHV